MGAATSAVPLLYILLLLGAAGLALGDLRGGEASVHAVEPSLYLGPGLRSLLQAEDISRDEETEQQARELAIAASTGQDEALLALLQSGVDPNVITVGKTPALWRAAFNNHPSTVRILLKAGAEINGKNANGTTSLYVAAQNGHIDVVKLLVNKGADVDIPSKWGSSPLLVAAQQGFADIVGVLLKSGAVPNIVKSKSGQGALWSAAFNGHEEVARLLLKKGAIVDVADATGTTPLFAAAQNNHTGVMEMLLAAGADPNKGRSDGNTPLHISAFYCHSSIVTLLVDHHADRGITNMMENTPIQLACQQGSDNPQDSDQFHTVIETLAPLFRAARLGDVSSTRRLIKAGENVWVVLFNGWGVLHEAAQNSRASVVRVLLSNGADVDAIDVVLKQSAAHVAARVGSGEILSDLARSGANLNLEDVNGRTPLHIAALHGQASTIPVLLEAGASVNGFDYAQQTAVHLAASGRHVDVLRALVSTGLDADALDQSGNTALHIATIRDDLEVLKAVIALGTNVNMQDRAGQTPLHIAARAGSAEIVQELLREGADQTIMDINGKVPKQVVGSDKRTPSSAEQLVMRLLLENGVGNLLQATWNGDKDGVSNWLDFGVQADYALSNGTTALHAATQTGDVEMVSLFLSSDANASIPDERGWTVLHYASFLGKNEVLEELTREDVNPDARDNDGRTALHLAPASKLAKLKTLELVLGFDGNVNSRDGDGKAPLHVAAENDRLKMTRALVDAGGDIHSLDNDGRKPIALLVPDLEPKRRHQFVSLLSRTEGSDPARRITTFESSSSSLARSQETAKSGMPTINLVFMILLPSVFVTLLFTLVVFIFKRSKENGITSCWEKYDMVETPSTIWTELYSPSEGSFPSSLPLRARQAHNVSPLPASPESMGRPPVVFPNPYFSAVDAEGGGDGEEGALEDAADEPLEGTAHRTMTAPVEGWQDPNAYGDKGPSSPRMVELPQRSCVSFSEERPGPAESPLHGRPKSNSMQFSFVPRPKIVPLPLHNVRVEIQRRRRHERYPTLYTDAASHFSSISSGSMWADTAYFTATSGGFGSRHMSQDSYGGSIGGGSGVEVKTIPEEETSQQVRRISSLQIPTPKESAFETGDVHSEP